MADGAGDGNRTRVASLEGWSSAIELHPRKKWSGRRGSDSRPPPWQGGALPTELLPHIGCQRKVRAMRLELIRHRHQILSLARLPFRHARVRPEADGNDPLEIRTPDTLIKSQVLCRLS